MVKTDTTFNGCKIIQFFFINRLMTGSKERWDQMMGEVK